jgi:hypothetical protein
MAADCLGELAGPLLAVELTRLRKANGIARPVDGRLSDPSSYGRFGSPEPLRMAATTSSRASDRPCS